MTGKVILISGLTQGLGSAMADEFIRLGHRLLGCGRSLTEGEPQQHYATLPGSDLQPTIHRAVTLEPLP